MNSIVNSWATWIDEIASFGNHHNYTRNIFEDLLWLFGKFMKYTLGYIVGYIASFYEIIKNAFMGPVNQQTPLSSPSQQALVSSQSMKLGLSDREKEIIKKAIAEKESLLRMCVKDMIQRAQYQLDLLRPFCEAYIQANKSYSGLIDAIKQQEYIAKNADKTELTRIHRLEYIEFQRKFNLREDISAITLFHCRFCHQEVPCKDIYEDTTRFSRRKNFICNSRNAPRFGGNFGDCDWVKTDYVQTAESVPDMPARNEAQQTLITLRQKLKGTHKPIKPECYERYSSLDKLLLSAKYYQADLSFYCKELKTINHIVSEMPISNHFPTIKPRSDYSALIVAYMMLIKIKEVLCIREPDKNIIIKHIITFLVSPNILLDNSVEDIARAFQKERRLR